MKILIGVNTLDSVETSVYSNHCQFWYRLGRNTQHTFLLNHPRRMSIDRMRNLSAKMAIDSNCDYLMFVDDDVLIPFDALDRLIKADADVCAGWTIIRGYPYRNMFFRYTDKEKFNLSNVKDEDLGEDLNAVIDVDAVGFSCVLIRVSALRQMEPPYFVTGPYNTEDIYFCVKGQKNIPGFSIKVDLQVKTSHNLGSEYIDPLTKKFYKVYYEGMYPEVFGEQKPEPPISIEEPKIGELHYEDVLEQVIWPEHTEEIGVALGDNLDLTANVAK